MRATSLATTPHAHSWQLLGHLSEGGLKVTRGGLSPCQHYASKLCWACKSCWVIQHTPNSCSES
eukprot:2963395-Amphidinium_carterae.1